MVADGYGSDSTEGDYTETNVLLGYASRNAEEDAISRLGGLPDWLDAEQPPSAALARCRACNDLMALLLQLNGELPERFPGHERRLYVFACRRSTCRRREGSIRALRAVRAWEEEAGEGAAQAAANDEPREARGSDPETAARPRLGETLFGATQALGGGGGAGDPPSSRANPFSSASSNPFTTTTANPFASAPAGPSPSPPQQRAPSPSLSKTFAESLRLDSAPAPAAATPEPWPATPAPKPFPTAYLSEADYETLDPTPAMVPAHARLEDAAETSALDREAFESAMDATFQRFADRLAQNPDQVIRYEFAGAPLLYSKTDPVGQRLADGPGPPACPACRARRAFEVQLTPNAIAELEAGDEPDLEGMEWGTVIVAVCERDCVPARAPKGHVAYFEEWAGVQWEELTKQK